MRSLLVLGALAGVACLSGCGEPGREPPPIDIDTLARTARLQIGPRSATQGPVLSVSSITVTLSRLQHLPGQGSPLGLLVLFRTCIQLCQGTYSPAWIMQ